MEALKNGKIINWKLNVHLFFIFIIFSLSIPNLVFANLSVFLNSPPNQTTTSDSTPDFNFTVSGTESSYSCELFINDMGYGTETANNNTPTIITANSSLSDGTYDWYVNCTANSVTNQSEVREITIDATSPVINFTSPTEPNGTTIPRNWTEVNMTIDEPDLDAFDFDRDYTELDNYLVGYWRFDNNSAYGEDNTHFYDYSGTGNNGTCSGSSCPNYTEGKKQLGLEFDGVDDYVEVPDDDSLDITDEITVEVWIKHFSRTDTNPRIVVKQPVNYAYLIWFDNANDQIGFRIRRDSDLTHNSAFASHTPDNTWHHFVGTYDGTYIKIYKDGILKDSVSFPGTIHITDGNLVIGGRQDGSQQFNGTIDELRIYNKSLSAEEVKQRYLSTRARYYDDSLVLAMNFNNNSAIGENSTKAVDISKYGNNGTIHGATWTTGKFGSALEFDGTDDYVDCGNDDSLDIESAVTIEAWVKLVDSDVNNYAVVQKGDTQYWLRSRLATDKWSFCIYDGEYHIAAADTTSERNVWTHLVGRYDNLTGEVSLWVNGEKQAETATSNNPVSNGYSVVIGKNNQAGGHYFHGTIDEVRIYNRALSEDEIKMHYLSEFQKYNSTQWRFYNNLTDLEDGTYAYYGWANDTA
ncbi:MAG: LamG domain-containing protein, partial [Candidatus Aenigmarchaeota archaeon]|nr:LamG domain-containing protein [Candidatus Aenigmarchaeota archaeon]